MSFSSDVKEEMLKHNDNARHCQIAELAAIIKSFGHIEGIKGREALVISIDRKALYRKCFTLLRKTYSIEDVSEIGHVNENADSGKSEIVIDNGKYIHEILSGIKAIDSKGNFLGFRGAADPVLIKNACCRQAYLRGTFECIGSMNDPNKGYHLEMVCDTMERAEQIVEILNSFEIDAKIVCRKKYFVVYIKEGSAVVDFLGICGAHVSLMNLESLRVMKEIGNTINRRVNCETANIARTAAAYNRLVEDINLIKKVYGFDNLPDNLREMAEARLEYPEATLKELGEMLDPPASKSCVNHRLRKLSEIAEDLR